MTKSIPVEPTKPSLGMITNIGPNKFKVIDLKDDYMTIQRLEKENRVKHLSKGSKLFLFGKKYEISKIDINRKIVLKQ